MSSISRRQAVLALSAAAASTALSRGLSRGASAQAQGRDELFSTLREPGLHGLPPEAAVQRVSESPAPAAAKPGRWETLPPVPLPRSEMAWAAAWGTGFHLIGGYGNRRVDTSFHHVYDTVKKRWIAAAPIPKAANHIGVVATDGVLYAMGGHLDQNRNPHAECFFYTINEDRWTAIAPMPRARGAVSVVALDGRIHAIGGATGKTRGSKKSVAWHEVYDPKVDKWEPRAPLPVGRDHMGAVVVGERIHVIAGRIDSARTNVDHHDLYLAEEDRWTRRAPLPTARSGHGAVLYRGKIFVMGGEAFTGRSAGGGLTGKVFGQNEAYDPASDSWRHYAPMPTPRHGLGAAVVGDGIHVAGGGPVVGGRVQSAVHEAFRLD